MEVLITVSLDYLLNFRLEVLILLLGTLSHVLNVLLFVEWYFQSATVCVHTLQNLPVLHRCLEESRIEWEPDALLDTLVLCKGIDTVLLELDQTAALAHVTDATHRLQRAS